MAIRMAATEYATGTKSRPRRVPALNRRRTERDGCGVTWYSRSMKFQSSIARLSPHPTRQRLGVAAGVAFLCSIAVAACGSATSGSSSSSSAAGTATSTAAVSTATATATPASGTTTLSCPTASEVGVALGITVPAPTNYGTSAAGISCNYLSGSADVILSIVHGIPTGYLTQAEATMQATLATLGFTAVSGVGDQAYTYSYAPSASETALGILAVKGTTFVEISCTGTTTTLSKVEAYASQLLG
jgi:hypothetical protein